jgi:DNA-binding response OmpR family regulator
MEVFTDPVKAAYHFKPEYYDACVLDIRMPEKNGFELARDIWRLDSKAQVCFLTAFTIYEDEAKKVLKNLKSHCFLTKPIFPSALVDHIEKHLVRASMTSPQGP